MRICVTAKEANADAIVEERFGRSPYFMIYDTETAAWTPVSNPVARQNGGVGPRAVQLLAGERVDAVLTGNVGGNARAALEEAGIDIYLVRQPGITVEAAYGQYREGKLLPFV
ncbi:MAG: dinitrogenase iron-molybdenum cofactor biosynthesis protein [Methanomicrobiales archaeon]|nr:dinitrogenase iron-molybdenum cofactor biosynthesis protein [Methanomicrobiales archaeon]